MLYWRPSVPDDVAVVAPRVRAIEVQECFDMSGSSDMHANLTGALVECDPCQTLVADDGSLLGMCGVTPFTPGVGIVWLLPTQECFEGVNRRQFIKLTRPWIEEQLDRYPVLFNLIHPENTLSIRWLSWAGCKFVACRMVRGTPYLLFVRHKDV